MKKLLITLGIAFAMQVFVACTNDDNPIPGLNEDKNPQEQPTDQPAN